MIREAVTDQDLEAWRQVRIAVYPNERAASVEEMRAMETPERVLLLAEIDGDVVGSGIADKSSLGERGWLTPRVLPRARRRGVGTALLRVLTAHVERLGFSEALSEVDGNDEGSLGFAHRFGFEEVDRQVEQVRPLGVEPAPEFPPGVAIVSIEQRPELLAAAYDLAVEGYADMATPWPATITRDDWLRDEATHAAGSVVALVDDEIVGYSGLIRDADNPGRAEDGLTVVRRDWRRRGLATALKRAEIAWAAANGIAEIYTWTQRGNEAMRHVNEQLGYRYRSVSLTVGAELPLPQ